MSRGILRVASSSATEEEVWLLRLEQQHRAKKRLQLIKTIAVIATHVGCLVLGTLIGHFVI